MWIDANGNVYIGDCRLGDRAATAEEVEAWELQRAAVFKTARFSSLEFLERFTETEQLAVVSATMANAKVKLWYDKLLAAEYVDLTDPRTEAGIDALVAAELIAAERKAALMTPEVAA